MDLIKLFEFLKKHIFHLLISMLFIGVVFLLLVQYWKDIKIKDHLMYILDQNENYSLNIGNDHLQYMLSTMEYCEELSYERLMDLWDIMEELSTRNDQEETEVLHEKIYKIANEDYSIIRMLMELDNIYCELAESDKGMKNTKEILVKKKQEEILKTFYTAYDLILQSKMDESLNDEVKQQKLKSAYMMFKKIYKNTEIFPENLRENIEIETLQFLTYCSFALTGKNKPLTKEKQKWNSFAKEIRENKKELKGSEYRRKYYWVDLSVFFANLSDDKDLKKEKKANNAFNTMVRDIYDIKFLKSKFKQYQNKIGPKINEYINRLENSASNNTHPEKDQVGSRIWPWLNGNKWDEAIEAEILMQLHESNMAANRD